MGSWSTLLILTAAIVAPTASVSEVAVEVYREGFENRGQFTAETLPDGWTRRSGPGFPRYLPAKVSFEPSYEGKRCLKLELDGNAVGVVSGAQPADDEHCWQASVMVRTERLVNDRVSLTLMFLNERREVVETVTSELVQSRGTWTTLSLGPVAPKHEATRWVQIGLQLEPTAGEMPDLVGSARFDELRLAETPRVRIESSDDVRLFQVGQPMVIDCSATGFTSPQDALVLRVTNPFNEVVDVRPVPLKTPGANPLLTSLSAAEASITLPQANLAAGRHDPAAGLSPERVDGVEVERRASHGSRQRWRIDTLPAGYYQLRIGYGAENARGWSEPWPVVVIEPWVSLGGGEFGWTLGDLNTLGAQSMRLVTHSGISKIKLPMIVDLYNVEGRKQLIAAADAWKRQQINLVAVVDQAPNVTPPDTKHRGAKEIAPSQRTAIELLEANPSDYYTALEPILARLAWQIDAWQWGRDGDLSCAGYTELNERVKAIKAQLDRVQGDSTIGLPWSARSLNDPAIAAPKRSWRFAAIDDAPASASVQPSSTAKGVEGKWREVKPATPQSSASTTHELARWVTLRPQATSEAPLNKRIDDLVARTLSAKLQGAAAIFVAQPFDPNYGLANAQGVPGDLYLPWRTTASLLDGTTYEGRLTLPGESDNYLFSHHRQAVMVMRRDSAGQESLFLGDGARRVDIWGHSRPLPLIDGRQLVDVESTCCFVVGLNLPIARWRMLAQTQLPRLATQFGVRQRDAVVVQNTFDRRVSGVLKLHAPAGWIVQPANLNVQLDPGQTAEFPIDWLLPLACDTGRQFCRMECVLSADGVYNFDAWLPLSVGDDMIEQTVIYRHGPAGELIVDQRLQNLGDQPRMFRCYCDAPNQRRQRNTVVVPAGASATATYKFDDAGQLKGQTIWLRAEDVASPDMLSRRLKIE
ncbi:MAG: hypothetical protein JSS27_19640 [Planctomycetes bacterium]|nr:hypothetical protein [Planctomycetota bacterium]